MKQQLEIALEKRPCTVTFDENKKEDALFYGIYQQIESVNSAEPVAVVEMLDPKILGQLIHVPVHWIRFTDVPNKPSQEEVKNSCTH